MYKIIKNNTIIDVVYHPHFVKFLTPDNIVITDRPSAQGIIGSDGQKLYCFTENLNDNLDVVTIEKIDHDEFKKLRGFLNSNYEIPANEAALEKLKYKKITLLSDICKSKITAGFTVVLSDGNSYNFKLTVEDQLNLMSLENQLSNGDNHFIYHATDMPCRLYSREDMCKIINAFRQHILYHTTYFNMAKHYIKSLACIEKINLFSYGTDISEYVNDRALKQIIMNGDSSI
jgi:hypothetical protein